MSQQPKSAVTASNMLATKDLTNAKQYSMEQTLSKRAASAQNVTMHHLRPVRSDTKQGLTSVSPAWPYLIASPGSEIRWGSPSAPHRSPCLAYMANRFSVLSMLALRARAGALSGSYCTKIASVSLASDTKRETAPDTYVLQTLLQDLDLGLLPLGERLALSARSESRDVSTGCIN